MPLLPTVQPAPKAVRVAGVLVAVEGLTALAFAVAVLVHALGMTKGASNEFGEAGYFGILALAVLAVAVGLMCGRRWSRTPATLVQILLVAVSAYAIGPTALVGPAVVAMLVALATLVSLFTAPSRAWAVGLLPTGAEPENH